MNTYKLEAIYKHNLTMFKGTFWSDDSLPMAKAVAKALIASGDFDDVIVTKNEDKVVSFLEDEK